MSGGVWVASYLVLWAAVVVLSFAVVVLLRQIGVLHARIRPVGAHPAGEGLPAGAPAPPIERDYGGAAVTLVTFVSPTCRICAELMPSLRALARDYDGVALEVVDFVPANEHTFRAFNVRSTPYITAVGPDGRIRVAGVVNSLEQTEELVSAAQLVETGGDR